MTDRMNEDAFRLVYWRQVDNGHEASDMANESARARREEAQLKDRIHALEVQQADLLRQVKEKDATIKALADALWDARQYGDDAGELCWCQSPCGTGFVHGRRPGCEAKEAVLRRVGRVS